MSIQVHVSGPNQQTTQVDEVSTESAKGTPAAEASADAKPAPEANASEQNKAADSEPVAAEESSDPVETEEGAKASESEESGEEDKDKPKKKGGFQRRIDKLNARVSEREREIEYWKQQALKGASEPKKEIETPAIKSAAGDGKPKPDDFDTHAEYVEAITDWKTDQKLKERDQKAANDRLEIEQKKVVQTYLERKNAFSEKTPDFDDVIDEASDITISQAVQNILLTSENGPELAYELAKRREDFARICKLPPLAAAREIGKIESAIAAKTPAQEQNKKKLTSAPAPVSPVGGSGKGSATRSIYDAHAMTQKEYEAVREKELQAKKRA